MWGSLILILEIVVKKSTSNLLIRSSAKIQRLEDSTSPKTNEMGCWNKARSILVVLRSILLKGINYVLVRIDPGLKQIDLDRAGTIPSVGDCALKSILRGCDRFWGVKDRSLIVGINYASNRIDHCLLWSILPWQGSIMPMPRSIMVVSSTSFKPSSLLNNLSPFKLKYFTCWSHT